MTISINDKTGLIRVPTHADASAFAELKGKYLNLTTAIMVGSLAAKELADEFIAAIIDKVELRAEEIRSQIAGGMGKIKDEYLRIEFTHPLTGQKYVMVFALYFDGSNELLRRLVVEHVDRKGKINLSAVVFTMDDEPNITNEHLIEVLAQTEMPFIREDIDIAHDGGLSIFERITRWFAWELPTVRFTFAGATS